MRVWVLRESFLAYERFHGVFPTVEEAVAAGPTGKWTFVRRTLPVYMWDDKDPFNSAEEAVCLQVGEHLWVAEPHAW